MEDCVFYKGRNRGYYRQVSLNGKLCGAHRLVYTMSHGPIPEGMVVRHTCDNPACENPNHLIIGTQRDNIQDTMDRGRVWKAKERFNTIEEIIRNTDPAGHCLIWKGKPAIVTDLPVKKNLSGMITVQRVVYFLVRGKQQVPGKKALPFCGSTLCVNPKHFK